MSQKMKEKSFSYDAALEELQQIVQRLQSDSVGIDGLNEKVERAAELIRLCKQKLRETEETLSKAFETTEQ